MQCDIHNDNPGSLCSDKRTVICLRARNKGQLLIGILSHGTRHLTISRELSDRKAEAVTLNNISQVYQEKGDNKIALNYLKQSLLIRKEVGDFAGEGTTLNNIARIYFDQSNYTKALEYLTQSLSVSMQIGNKEGEAVMCWNIGMIYYSQFSLLQAKQYMSRAVELGEIIAHPKMDEWRNALKVVQMLRQG